MILLMGKNVCLISLIILIVLAIHVHAQSQLEHKITAAGQFSASQTQTQIVNIQATKNHQALTIIFKSKQDSVQNDIQLTIRSGNQIKLCSINIKQNICAINEPELATVNLTFECKSSKCQIFWEAHQSSLHQLSQGRLHHLYQITRQQTRMFLNIICREISIKKLLPEIKVFSNSEFQMLQEHGIMQILFPQLKPGYIYFQMSEAVQQCGDLKILRVDQKLSIQKQSKGFLNKGQQYGYYIQSQVYTDLSLKLNIHSLTINSNTEHLTVQVMGLNQRQQGKVIQKNIINLPPRFEFESIIYVIRKIVVPYKKLYVRFSMQNSTVLFDIMVLQTDVLQIKATQSSYFQLEKGDILQYKIPQEPYAEQGDKINIRLSDQYKISASQSQCYLNIGCQFTITANQDISGNIYLGSGDGSLEEIIVLDMKSQLSFTRKLPKGQLVYIKKQFELKKNYQIVTNSPNIIVYMAPKSQCLIPNEQCYRDIANLKKHFIYSVGNQLQKSVIFSIKALDNTQFTITIIPTQSSSIKLKQSQPFAYIMDDQQQYLSFTFNLPENAYKMDSDGFKCLYDLTINLVAPIHSVFLESQNENDKEIITSSQGFIMYKSSDIVSPVFYINVRKNKQYAERFIHFTIIASSSNKEIRLQSGNTYYETLAPNQQSRSEFIFQFNRDLEYVLNFYSHNVKQKNINIDFDLSAQNKWTPDSQVQKMIIDRPSDLLKINQVAEKLCVDEGQSGKNCELFMKLQNKMDIEIDIAITLMAKHQIIELKDGIWQNFVVDSVSKTTHFYFQPVHSEEDVTIFYKTNQHDLRIIYKVFHGSQVKINPAQWPFPMNKQISLSDLAQSRPINQISISKRQIQQCWPYCYVLMSLIQANQIEQKGSFGLMASNSIMQIPQNQKISIILSTNEEKIFLVDLKYALSKNKDLHFSIFHSIGSTSIEANVYSEKNVRIPYQQHTDFLLNNKQNLIKIQKIREIISQQKMSQDTNIYLYVMMFGIQNSKLSIEYALQSGLNLHAKQLTLNSFEQVEIKQKSQKFYKIQTEFVSKIKIIMQEGVPYIASSLCKTQQQQNCFNDLSSQLPSDSLQVMTKIQTLEVDQCLDCLFIFRIFTSDGSKVKLQLHPQSQYSHIQLSQGKIIYDYMQGQQINKYALFLVRGEKGYININVREGQVKVHISDMDKISMEKTGKGLISFQINSQGGLKDKQQVAQARKQLAFTSFKFSDQFIQIYISVQSISQQSAAYTVIYSSGQRKFDLQDGMINQYSLQPNVEQRFYYSSQYKTQSYFMITVQNKKIIDQLTTKIRYCEPKDGIIEPACWKQLKIEKPAPIPHSPNPTFLINLPGYENFQFIIVYTGQNEQKLSVSINHEQFMILPYNFKYPFIVSKKKQKVFLVDVLNEGYIHLYIQKCDEGNPTLSYTDDYESFKKKDFDQEINLNMIPRSQFSTKVKPGTFYIRFTSDSNPISMTIKIVFSKIKIQNNKLVAGRKGILQYQIIGSDLVQIKLYPVQCPQNGHCQNMKYYIIESSSLQNLNRQLICPSQMYHLSQFILFPVHLTPAEVYQQPDKSLKIIYTMTDKDRFVSIRAADESGKQIYYHPIEIISFLGELSHINITYLGLIIISFLFVLGIFSYIITKNARKGYTKIVQMQ